MHIQAILSYENLRKLHRHNRHHVSSKGLRQGGAILFSQFGQSAFACLPSCASSCVRAERRRAVTLTTVAFRAHSCVNCLRTHPTPRLRLLCIRPRARLHPKSLQFSFCSFVSFQNKPSQIQSFSRASRERRNIRFCV